MDAGERAHVGVVGDRVSPDVVEDASASVGADATTTAGDPATVLAADPDWVLVAGDDALSDLVAGGMDLPVLAVGAEAGVGGVRRDAVEDAIARILAGEVPTTTRRLYDAMVDGERAATVLRDAMLITDEPARISEYALRSGDEVVARFRADGVVVATPAGSTGYLSAAGGPVVEPGTRSLAAVPVAPFQTDSDHWVLADDGVSLTVHRDESVLLVVDGRETGTVPPEEPVDLVPSGALSLYAAGGDWKNSNGRRPE